MAHFIAQIVCLLQETGPGNLRNSEASVIELRDGRLLLAYTHFYADADDCGAGDIRGKISADGGKSWSKPFVVRPNRARYNTGRLSLIRLAPTKALRAMFGRPGLLGLVYLDINDFHNQTCLATSVDEGANWATPIPINDTGSLGFITQRSDTAVVLRGGRILVPSYAVFGGLWASFMYFSDDNGVTWQRSLGDIAVELRDGGLVIGHTDFEEPAVAELRDGRLLCLGRTRLGQLYQSFSDDQGQTWGPAEPSGLASSYSPASLKVIPTTGDLLCVWNQVSGQEITDNLGRMRLSCAVSRDDGRSWTHFQNLESLDDTARIEPEGGKDAVSELNAIKARRALKVGSTQTAYPPEVTRRYPRWPGYIHNDYPSAAFTSTGNVVFTYLASDYELAALPIGLKLVVRPVDWLYRK